MTLDLTPAERERLGRAALEWVLEWFSYPATRPLVRPADATALRDLFDEPVPEDGEDFAGVLDRFSQHIATAGRDNGHPRMFGYVQSSHAYVGVLADFLASALNQNVTAWRSSPSATTVERQTIAWIRQIIGFDASGDGLFVSGGSAANLVAIAAALASRFPTVAQQGVRALRGEPALYASDMAHMSVLKAAAILGLGRDAVRRIPVDDAFRMDVNALDRALRDDRAASRVPICVVANAGDVNTGAVDPLPAIASLCRTHGVWLHADAAYGGFAMLSPSGRQALEGCAQVDSIALDPHKWLYAPIDVGCVLVRDAEALARAFAYTESYIDVFATPSMSEFAFWNYGPELTRRFRALKVWMMLKCHGTRALGEAIERNIALARRLGDLIDEAPDFERLAPIPLSIVCFRYRPEASRDDPAALNALNRSAMMAVQAGGRAYLSNTMIGDAFALRACIVNFRTREDDLTALLDDIRTRARSG